MFKIVLLSFLMFASSVSANSYLITHTRIQELVRKWNNSLDETHNIIPGVSYYFDERSKRLPHDLVIRNAFKVCRTRYLNAHSFPTAEGFIAYASGNHALGQDDPEIILHQERLENFITSTGTFTYRLNGDLNVDLRLLCFFLSSCYITYMIVGEMTPRDFPCSLQILVEVTGEDVKITTNYL